MKYTITDPVNDTYCKWIFNQLDIKLEDYTILVKKLMNTKYYYKVWMDIDRRKKVFEFREPFYKLNVCNCVNYTGAPSVFEVMVAFSFDVNRYCYGMPWDKFHDTWLLRQMLMNLDIFIKDTNMTDTLSEHIDKKIKVFLERDYDKYGIGGPFPIKFNNTYKFDQRTRDLLYQMYDWKNQFELPGSSLRRSNEDFCYNQEGY